MKCGPLASLKVVEFSGLGPAPLAGQLLADLGADVVTVDRAAAAQDPTDINRRGKRSVILDLKADAGRGAALRLIEDRDILVEGFRPGVMERLGLGPDDCHDRLVYARMTGWGQDGPMARTAGHDITYLAVTGALHAMGAPDEPPIPPLNLVADYGGGTMFLLYGILAAIIERSVSGKGQVVDAAMVDGVPAMMGLVHGMLASGFWTPARGANWLDGAAPFYRCYACSDGKYVAVGALEPQFFAVLIDGLGLPRSYCETQNDRATWAARKQEFAAVFATKTRDDWVAQFAATDACVAPVLTFAEAAEHPQLSARQTLVSPGGIQQAAPAPRFSRSDVAPVADVPAVGAHTEAVLSELGFSEVEIEALRP